MKLRRFALAFFCIANASVLAADEGKHRFKPAAGVVPDGATAIKIAVAVWEPIYGARNIARQKPYRATLIDGVWTVEGTLAKQRFGGVALVEISKANGRVLRITHGR